MYNPFGPVPTSHGLTQVCHHVYQIKRCVFAIDICILCAVDGDVSLTKECMSFLDILIPHAAQCEASSTKERTCLPDSAIVYTVLDDALDVCDRKICMSRLNIVISVALCPIHVWVFYMPGTL